MLFPFVYPNPSTLLAMYYFLDKYLCTFNLFVSLNLKCIAWGRREIKCIVCRQHIVGSCFFVCLFVLAIPCGLGDLSSPTRD